MSLVENSILALFLHVQGSKSPICTCMTPGTKDENEQAQLLCEPHSTKLRVSEAEVCRTTRVTVILIKAPRDYFTTLHNHIVQDGRDS